ncbi:MAG: UDP-N-acetylmuramate dehydrogenase [Actinobacteria bacterium]|uniref:UDP-N-acetylmuramate dehydrogenase n=1 Tax=freshwater metagenome TaxID=449393 RepID=A0A6J7I7U7_9ZZZZ|nr:UDP-N-acetylmuramate dehydrogenase [Actinomycetota bacterium]MTA77504.1 UDP-N-acetylmuramate dehydrogenase [Actinomycetota bacterium]
MNRLEAAIAGLVESLGDRAQPAAPLGALTTYRVGGRAAVLVTAESIDDLRAIGDVLSSDVDREIELLVVGRGSNMLVADQGFAGIAVLLGDGLTRVTVDGTTVVAGGAAALPVVARRTVAAGLTGFEWAVGVPGSIGGAVRMNAGGHGSDMAASVSGVRVLDLRTGEDDTMQAVALGFGYRSSSLRSHQVVVDCTLELALGSVEAGESELGDIVRWRREHQPGGANAGSVFTNPIGHSAGRLIDQAGLKGFRLGSAEVSTKHANFIQSEPGGSADDIAALMAEIRRRVLAETDVDLHAETHLVGFDPRAVSDAGAGI